MVHQINVSKSIKDFSKEAQLLTLSTLTSVVNYNKNQRFLRFVSTWLSKFHNLTLPIFLIWMFHYKMAFFGQWINHHRKCCWTTTFLKPNHYFSLYLNIFHSSHDFCLEFQEIWILITEVSISPPWIILLY